MEFSARYTLIAVFALGVMAAVFGFVYWLTNSAGFARQAEYQVRFSVPVSGMSSGSNVLFNGLKVGEVKSLNLDPVEPGQFLATISIDARTPVRTDTKAGVDYQGLTGAANVSLTGGSADAPPLEATGSGVPVLVAAPADSRSWTTSAARVLSSLDEMLAGESNRLDSILAGLERMVGGGDEDETGLFDLPTPAFEDGAFEELPAQLVIAEPSVLLALNTDKLLRLDSELAWSQVGSATWTDNLPNLFQSKLIQGFENAGLGDKIIRPADAFDPPYRLTIDVRRFHFKNYGDREAVIDLVSKIIGGDGSVYGSTRIRTALPVESETPEAVARGMGNLFSEAASELITWSSDLMRKLEE